MSEPYEEPAPEAFVGNRKLDFFIEFPIGNFIEPIRAEIAKERGEPESDEEFEAFEQAVAHRYQEHLASQFEAATSLTTRPHHLTGREVGGPGIGFDPLFLYGLFTVANVAVGSINDWADMAERIGKVLAWLKRKAKGDEPAISDGVALILGADALRRETQRDDLQVAFVSELNEFPAPGGDDAPCWDVDFLVGARSKHWLYLCRVSDRGDTLLIGRIRYEETSRRERPV